MAGRQKETIVSRSDLLGRFVVSIWLSGFIFYRDQ